MRNALSAIALTVLVVIATSLYFTTVAPWLSKPKPSAPPEQVTVDEFQRLWYFNRNASRTSWMGVPTQQNPMDVWITQEIMFDTKPDFVVECGSYMGGSAAVWATLLAQANPAGRVISIDVLDRMDEARKLPIVKERVEFLIGSSTDSAIVAEVARRVSGKKVMVILDSLHTEEHVLDELRSYSPLVREGQYIEVQDTNINGHPVRPPGFGPGPYEAVQDFLAGNKAFVVDRDRERLILTFCPSGFLKRVR